jgi:alanyl-tRNA synthetase
VKSAAQVRQEFIDFFVARGHRFVPSSSVVPQDDPTLLFTNAGMNQFKDVFLGTGKRDYTRAVNSQKCIRVSGKHNDLEEVGLDTYHHTFFEMLGNWSFGDYFKDDAIAWSWELLTKVWGLPKERLWVTVFGGDAKDRLPADEDAARIWRERSDIDPTHILLFGRKDNFWEMGASGPCGPCTEIHIDRGGPGSDPRDGANPKIGVNAGNERFIELWNNVFMQFNRLDDGSLRDLPAKHVDTGMGFERVLAVMQGKLSNYDTDLFQPLFRRLEVLTGKRYGADAQSDVAFRVIADHIRAVSAAIADGALPSNDGRGYVIRRLVRRASRFGRQRLGMSQPFIFDVAPTVAEILGPAFPELRARQEHIQLLVRAEEESFGLTLDRGLVLFDQLVTKVEKTGAKTLPGDQAYDLYATYGFPQDLVELMLRERSWTLDQAGWSAAQEKHRSASRSEGKFKQILSPEELEGLSTKSTYHDRGPTSRTLESRVIFFDAEERGSLATGKIVLDASPFYPEGGGQVGDVGWLDALDKSWRLIVEDTRRIGNVVVHVGQFTSSIVDKDLFGERVRATVDVERRDRTRKNHTATHLLHKALKEVLGAHVNQQGSYVGPDRLRFDFSHPKALTPEELEEIERRVNAQVFANSAVGTTEEDLAAAKARGVTALFGEKYEDRVRVVAVGEYSTELCGGTHVNAAGDIGPFVIASERAIQAGVRRIEALTGPDAVALIQSQRRTLTAAARSLKSPPEELVARIEQLQTQLKEAKKKDAANSKADVGAAFDAIKSQLATRSGVLCGVVDLPEVDGEAIRELGDRVKTLAKDLAVVLFGRQEGRVPFLIACEGAALARGLKAGDVAKLVAAHLGGGGGGRPNLAQGQGLDAGGVAAALAAARQALDAKLQ